MIKVLRKVHQLAANPGATKDSILESLDIAFELFLPDFEHLEAKLGPKKGSDQLTIRVAHGGNSCATFKLQDPNGKCSSKPR